MMKKVIFQILILSSFSIKSFAQPQPGENILNPNLDNFTGTWQWIDGTDTVKIFLKKENVLFPIVNYRRDVLIGFHIYKQGNIVVESSYDYINTGYINKHNTIVVYNTDGSNKVEGTLTDITKNKTASLILIINGTFNQLQWELEGIGSYTGPHRPGFTLPKNLILLKQ